MNQNGKRRGARRENPLKALLWRLYLVIVFISAVIVALYIGWNMVVKPPEVAPPVTGGDVAVTAPSISGSTGESGSSSSSSESNGLPVLERKEGFYNILLMGCDDGNGNADTIMVVGYDTKAGTCHLVSVPRDTLIERDWTKFPKLNSAYGHGGTALVAEEVSNTLGIPIDYYIKIELTAFEAVVNELGGLDYYVPQDMYHDDEAGFIIDLKEGQQHLNGHETLELVRFRGYANADIGRTQVQQQVLKALAQKALSWNSVTKINSFVEIFNSYVDTDLSLTDMLYLAQSAISIDMANDVTTQTLAGRGDGVKNGTSWCYELDAEKVLETVNACLNPYTTPLDSRYLNIAMADRYLQ